MSVTAARGFRAAGATAGLKPSGNPDVALVVNDGPTDVAAAVFTANRCKANPVLWSEQVLGDGTARAVVLNSGGANCYTGPDGFQTTHACAEAVAARLGIAAGEVVVCSTGVIGAQLDRGRLLAGIADVSDGLSSDGGDAAATAIMTTDTRAKQAVRSGAGWTIGGMAKGAGMLAPALATMLVVVTTDAAVDQATADEALRAATRSTFDRIDSDGAMSTNDTVVLLSSGDSGVTPDGAEFAAALRDLCHDLAQQLLTDAEGAEHDIAIEVVNAVSEQEATTVGRSVARNNLFKCAIYGRDPYWGRVLAAIGTTDATFDPMDVDIAFDDVWLCRSGAPVDPTGALAEHVDLGKRDLTVTIDLKAGTSAATIWTNDLTHAYVTENSAYTT